MVLLVAVVALVVGFLVVLMLVGLSCGLWDAQMVQGMVAGLSGRGAL